MAAEALTESAARQARGDEAISLQRMPAEDRGEVAEFVVDFGGVGDSLSGISSSMLRERANRFAAGSESMADLEPHKLEAFEAFKAELTRNLASRSGFRAGNLNGTDRKNFRLMIGDW